MTGQITVRNRKGIQHNLIVKCGEFGFGKLAVYCVYSPRRLILGTWLSSSSLVRDRD